MFQQIRQLLGAIVLSLACITVIGSLQIPKLNYLKSTKPTLSQAELNRQIEAENLYLTLTQKLPALGFDNLVADWTLIRFLQYFGDDEARGRTDYRLSPEYFEIILKRDPRFLEAYFFLSGSTSLYAGMPERTIALMNQGLKFVTPQIPPRSFYIWRYKGTDELLFLGDAKASEQSFITAADWAATYPDQESQQISYVSRRTAQFLANNPQSKNAQVAAWSLVLNNARDDRTRQIAIDRIRILGGDVVASPQGFRIIPPAKD